jgi:hypothetical protein
MIVKQGTRNQAPDAAEPAKVRAAAASREP